MSTDAELTHIDAAGSARMVDVSDKRATRRRARARATVRVSTQTATILARGNAPKGDVIGTARIAGIQAAKRTADLIPLAHPLPLTSVSVEIELDERTGTITIESQAQTIANTGVEMEALTAAAVAALTVYDMVKGVERGTTIEQIVLLEKAGGKEDWRRE